MEITLNIAEQKLATFLARSRNEHSRAAGIKDQEVGKTGSLDIDIEGMGAEVAFCKLINVYPDTEIETTPDADCHSTRLGGIDVKATKYRNGHLLARISKESHPPDSYALMIGEFPKYKFAGWIEAEKLLVSENIIDLGHGPTYALSQDKLRSLR